MKALAHVTVIGRVIRRRKKIVRRILVAAHLERAVHVIEISNQKGFAFKIATASSVSHVESTQSGHLMYAQSSSSALAVKNFVPVIFM
jgi:hypothetical protein